MIDSQDILASFRNELASHLATFAPPPIEPLAISPWLAMSLFQKSIRRRRVDLAISAAATLMVADPGRLWRRLTGTAVEDVGLADPCVVGLVTSVLAGKRIRAHLGGEWPVAAWLTQRLAGATKSRATDDLLMAAESLPNLASQRQNFADLSHTQLRLIILGTSSLHERAIALIYLAGTEGRPSPYFRLRRGEPALAFDVLDELGAVPTIIEVSRESYRRAREPLWLLLPLLTVEWDNEVSMVSDDIVPPEVKTGPVPSWTLDAYSREGKEGIRHFIRTQAGLAQWTRQHLPPAERVGFVARTLFHVEGGLLARRHRSDLSDELRRINEEEGSGVLPDQAREAMALMRTDLPLLDAIRIEIMEGRRHA